MKFKVRHYGRKENVRGGKGKECCPSKLMAIQVHKHLGVGTEQKSIGKRKTARMFEKRGSGVARRERAGENLREGRLLFQTVEERKPKKNGEGAEKRKATGNERKMDSRRQKRGVVCLL